jgi:hypothetical protein
MSITGKVCPKKRKSPTKKSDAFREKIETDRKKDGKQF